MIYTTVNKKFFFSAWVLSWVVFVAILCALYFTIDIKKIPAFLSLSSAVLALLLLLISIGQIAYRWTYVNIKNTCRLGFYIDAFSNYVLFASEIIDKVADSNTIFYIVLALNIALSISIKLYIGIKFIKPDIDYKIGEMVFLRDKFDRHKVRTTVEVLIILTSMLFIILRGMNVIMWGPIEVALIILIGMPLIWVMSDIIDKILKKRKIY